MLSTQERYTAFAIFVVACFIEAMAPWNLNAASAQQTSRPFDEKAVADFYRGRTASIVVGFAPGGGYDIVSRLIAKHLGKYVPGHPNIIVENRPGAGSLVAANLVYKTLPKDGTVIANFHSQMLLQQAQGQEGIEFDGRRYNWLGSVSRSYGACAVHKDTGVSHLRQIMGPSGRTVTVGGEAPGSGITDTAAVIRAALGAKLRIIYGYAGQRPIANAVLSRELEGFCTSWESFVSSLRSFFEPTKLLNMLVILGSTVPDHPWLENAVAAEAAAPNEKARMLLKIVDSPRRITYPYAVAPGVPTDRAAALRDAFDRTLADAEFISAFKKTGTPLEPANGEEVTRIVNELLSTDRDTVAAVKEALKRKEGP
jgi:tripartite-type tricarboxylate transporter receptor subunit TctC